MRAALLALLLVGIAATAAGQSHGSGLTDDMPTPSIGLPLPHIGLPLPTIGLPLPSMGLPPERTGRPERSERSERSERLNRSERPASVIFFGPTYGWPYLPVAPFPSLPSTTAPIKRAAGRVRLILHSGVDPQIFVDGYYMGLFSDVLGELTLEVGAHTIELREEGYQSSRVAVNVPLDDVITYDVDLKPIVPAPLPAVAPVASAAAAPEPPPTTIYVIRGCYVGNVPPKDAGLPAGCDASRAVAFPSRP